MTWPPRGPLDHARKPCTTPIGLTEALREHEGIRAIVVSMKPLLLLLITACVSTRTPVSPTTPDLAARRAQMIAWLHDYAAAGVFPRDDAGRPLSVFRDTHGVRCPMAELIFRSGHADLVDQVATTHNDLRLADVHSGPLHAWILASGLTQEEVVMIQGALTVDEMRQMREAQEANQLKLAREWGEVAGHLQTAEVALRAATYEALKVAQIRRVLRTTPISTGTLETRR